MPSITLKINHDGAKAFTESDTSTPKQFVNLLKNFTKAISCGAVNASIEQTTSTTALVKASGTLTAVSCANNDTCVINGTTLTAKTSPSGASEFLTTGSDTVVAAALVACINAHASFVGLVTAANVAGVVTISAAQSGVMGNCITLVGTATRLAASVSRLAGGTGDNASVVSFSLGK